MASRVPSPKQSTGDRTAFRRAPALPKARFPPPVSSVQTIVINLPPDDAQWVDVRRQFYRARLQPIYHEATDGSELSQKEVDGLYSAELNRVQYNRPLTRGEIGCNATHLAVRKPAAPSSAAAACRDSRARTC